MERAKSALNIAFVSQQVYDAGFAKVLLAEMEIIQPKRVSKSVLEGFHDAIAYFRNHHHQMHYVEAIDSNLPIGSGITVQARLPAK